MSQSEFQYRQNSSLYKNNSNIIIEEISVSSSDSVYWMQVEYKVQVDLIL